MSTPSTGRVGEENFGMVATVTEPSIAAITRTINTRIVNPGEADWLVEARSVARPVDGSGVTGPIEYEKPVLTHLQLTRANIITLSVQDEAALRDISEIVDGIYEVLGLEPLAWTETSS